MRRPVYVCVAAPGVAAVLAAVASGAGWRVQRVPSTVASYGVEFFRVAWHSSALRGTRVYGSRLPCGDRGSRFGGDRFG